MIGPPWVLRITVPLDHWVRLNKPEEVGFANAARRSVEDLAPERAGAVPPPISFILEKELIEHNAIMREAAGAGAREATITRQIAVREAP
jgi:hypothetical protein